jgi:hypothetical protein
MSRLSGRPLHAAMVVTLGVATALSLAAPAHAAGSSDYGQGRVYYEPMPGTYPPGIDTSFFNNWEIYVHDPAGGTALDDYCNPTGNTTPASCVTEDTLTDGDGWRAGVGDGEAPDGWFLPADITGTFDTSSSSCQQQSADARSASTQEGTNVGVCTLGTLEVPGTWRHVEVNVTDTATGEPVPGVTVDLTGQAPWSPQQQSSGRRSSARANGVDTDLGSQVTDSSGTAEWDGWFAAASPTSYGATITSAPAGFTLPGGPQSLAAPAITSSGQAGHPFVGSVGLVPLAPIANDDSSYGQYGATQDIDVLANDKAVSPPLSLVTVTQPANGHVRIDAKTQQVTFRPADGFTGTTSFTYTVRNVLGGTATADVNVEVGGDTIAGGAGGNGPTPQPSTLPFTGFDTTIGAALGGGVALLGTVLTAFGVRRRRD